MWHFRKKSEIVCNYVSEIMYFIIMKADQALSIIYTVLLYKKLYKKTKQ